MTEVLVQASQDESDAAAERVLAAALGTFETLSTYLGDRLGLYRALADRPTTAGELATRSGLNGRLVREWLEQQAVCGILSVEQPESDPSRRVYRLPAGYADVLVNGDSLNYMAPLARLVVSLTGPLPQLLDAFRNGGGVPWQAYGTDAREGQADINRPVFLELLCKEWLPSIPDVHSRLGSEPPARLADFGCGVGWSSIALARGYPKVRVDGFDNDPASIAEARRVLGESDVQERVAFHLRDAGDSSLEGTYDLVTIFEALHDMSRPVDALKAARRLLAPDGSVFIVDERVGEEFAAPGDDIERLMYGWSVFCCLPAAMGEPGSAETGTVMRPETVRRYAEEAGFGKTEVIELGHPFFRGYRLLP
jgi:SAM-dependent methyltransferase